MIQKKVFVFFVFSSLLFSPSARADQFWKQLGGELPSLADEIRSGVFGFGQWYYTQSFPPDHGIERLFRVTNRLEGFRKQFSRPNVCRSYSGLSRSSLSRKISVINRHARAFHHFWWAGTRGRMNSTFSFEHSASMLNNVADDLDNMADIIDRCLDNIEELAPESSHILRSDDKTFSGKARKNHKLYVERYGIKTYEDLAPELDSEDYDSGINGKVIFSDIRWIIPGTDEAHLKAFNYSFRVGKSGFPTFIDASSIPKEILVKWSIDNLDDYAAICFISGKRYPEGDYTKKGLTNTRIREFEDKIFGIVRTFAAQ